MKAIIEFASASLMALICSIVIYLFFKDMNFATFKNTGIELAGPVAFFVIILTIALRYFKKRPYSDDPLMPAKKQIVGSWKVIAESAHAHKAESTSDIILSDGNINITGGQFISEGKPLGLWKVLGFFLDNNSLMYIYQLTEAGKSGASMKGLVTLNIMQKDKLAGIWELIDPNYKSGTITYVRQ